MHVVRRAHALTFLAAARPSMEYAPRRASARFHSSAPYKAWIYL
jgi:hypothetical protein